MYRPVRSPSDCDEGPATLQNMKGTTGAFHANKHLPRYLDLPCILLILNNQGTKGKASGDTSSQVLGSGSEASFQRCQNRASACLARSSSSTHTESSQLLEILDQARLWLTKITVS